jgi:CheY-like chemotaxis protein
MSERMPRVLMVDDLEDNLVALTAILKSLPVTLVQARSGEEAMKALLRDDFAVVLLDVLMPGMDGFETATHIKRLDKTRNVPIIFLTAADSAPAYAFRGYSVGAVDYLMKPFDPWVLRAKVEVFVDLYRKNLQLKEQAMAATQPPGATCALRAAEVTAVLDRMSVTLRAADQDTPFTATLADQLADLRIAVDALVAAAGIIG